MVRHRRVFSREFKLEAVRVVTEGQRPVREVAQELGIHPELLRSWRRQFAAAGEVSKPVVSVEKKNRQLRREVETLRQERDFAKKAAAFFARDQRGGTR